MFALNLISFVAAASFLPGTIINSYEIINQISSGSYANIYKAKSKDMFVALKVMRPVPAPGLRQLIYKDFEIEFNVLSRLSHKYSPVVYELFNLDDINDKTESKAQIVSVIAMQFINGMTLFEYSREPRDDSYFVRLPILMTKLAFAVKEFHSLGICNNNISPSNFLITPDYNIFITSFSKATVFKQVVRYRGRSLNVPPELAKLNVKDCQLLDVYQLGLVYYTLISSIDNVLSIFPDYYDDDDLKIGGAFVFDGSSKIEVLVKSMLDFDPEKRPNIEQVLQELEL